MMVKQIARHVRGNVVAYLALFVALSGTAVASGVLNKKKVNHIISKRAPGLSVAHATNADHIPGLSFTPLTLINGWVPSGRPPAYAVDAQGVVHFEGGLKDGTASVAFHMPASLLPNGTASMPVREFNSETGSVNVVPNGVVTVIEDPDHPGSAAQSTSLDGVTYVPGG